MDGTSVSQAAALREAGDAVCSQPGEDKDLQTAFVQDMLSTDPVVALGMRVAAASGSAVLEYISIDEARADLRAFFATVDASLQHC